MEITKYDEKLKDLEENIRFYLNTPEKFAEALIFAKKLEKFAEEIKEKVKKRGSELMFDKDLKQIEFGDYIVKRIEASESNEYDVKSTLTAFFEEYGVEDGLINATQFLKVSTGKIEKWLMKAKMPDKFLITVRQNVKTKHKKGYIRLDEKK
jgi:hypothetical protein